MKTSLFTSLLLLLCVTTSQPVSAESGPGNSSSPGLINIEDGKCLFELDEVRELIIPDRDEGHVMSLHAKDDKEFEMLKRVQYNYISVSVGLGPIFGNKVGSKLELEDGIFIPFDTKKFDNLHQFKLKLLQDYKARLCDPSVPVIQE